MQPIRQHIAESRTHPLVGYEGQGGPGASRRAIFSAGTMLVCGLLYLGFAIVEVLL